MDDQYAGSVGTPVTSEETVRRDLMKRSSKTGEKIVQKEEQPA
jgi:hypothetical protein